MFLFKFEPNDIYMAYLPLAHELELLSECTMMVFGVAVGYSSPNTMTDMSTKVAKGNKGDAGILKPTMMCVVPLILDRIYKNIIDSVNKRGSNFQKAFEFTGPGTDTRPPSWTRSCSTRSSPCSVAG